MDNPTITAEQVAEAAWNGTIGDLSHFSLADLIADQAAQLVELTADRDSWRDQASQRTADWEAERDRADELEAWQRDVMAMPVEAMHVLDGSVGDLIRRPTLPERK